MLSDLYAMGVSECDNMLMLLGVSEKMTRIERDVVTPMVIQGFIGERNIITNIYNYNICKFYLLVKYAVVIVIFKNIFYLYLNCYEF